MASRTPPKGPSQGLFDFGPPARAPMNEEVREEIVPAPPTKAKEEPKIFSVGELVRSASRMLEARFPAVWVEGEVTNLSKPRSGHVYFSLTEPDACLPSVMFRTQAVRVKLDVQEGMRVRARGRLSIFEGQGKFQLYVDALEPAGLGALQIAFEELKARLQAEGLFDLAKKRALPRWPRRIGVCTSPTGAVIRDVVRVAERRGRVKILLSPCQVQGPTAAIEIRAALQRLQTIPDVDVIIVARGGGSAEDLAAFNDEALARAIRACRVPVVSAVGHEVDFTIADFVADVRAPTPSAAAELCVPSWSELATRLEEAQKRLQRAGAHVIADGRLALDDALLHAGRALGQKVLGKRRSLEEQRRRLAALHPRARLTSDRARLSACEGKLREAMRAHLQRRQRDYRALGGTLSALSPLRVLERGYAIARKEGHILTGTENVEAGAAVEVLLSRGALECRVESIRPAETEGEAKGADRGRRS